MKRIKNLTLLATIGLIATSAQAVDLSKVPEVRHESISEVNKAGFLKDERPKHCTYANDKELSDPACYDFVLSQKDAFITYTNKSIHLGKPLTEGNKARENKEGLQTITNRIMSVYAGTETAILNKKPELNLSLAGLFNTFNRSITAVEPYVLSIANGHYDKETLDKLQIFNNVFTNGWQKSAPAMVKFKGITDEEAVASSRYYKQELDKIRNILTQLNKYYQ